MIWFDLLMAFLMFIFGLYFIKSNGKAMNLLTGYHSCSGSDRKKQDENIMCRSYGKRMMIMGLPFLAGAVIDYYASGVGCVLAWICWIILFVFLLIDRTKREGK